MRTIAICNRKGGVAKTTTAVNLAAILARDHGKRVLVVDADSQGNATSFLGGDREAVGMAALLRGEISEERPLQLQATNVEGAALISGSDELMDLDLTKAGDGRADAQCLRKLREQLEAAEPAQRAAEGVSPYDVILGRAFDYCLIDCPPAFNAASSAALIAADEVLIPVKLDAFALEGMANLLQQISNMRRINPRLRVLGVLPVMWYRSEATVKAEAALRGAGLKVLPRIRRSDRVDDMTYAQAPLIVCSPRSGPCMDYRNLARWLVWGRTDCHTSAAAQTSAEPLREHDVGKRGRGRPRKERTAQGKRIATAACAQTSLERRALPARRDARNDSVKEGGAGNG